MKRPINPNDLPQINVESLERLTKAEIISLALKLRDYSIELYERLNLDSSNSSRPPSSDSPLMTKQMKKRKTLRIMTKTMKLRTIMERTMRLKKMRPKTMRSRMMKELRAEN